MMMMNSRYASCLEYLENLRGNLMLDIHLHDHVETLYSDIRHRAIIQYTHPFISVDLNTMASAFKTSISGLEKELEELITENQIQVLSLSLTFCTLLFRTVIFSCSAPSCSISAFTFSLIPSLYPHLSTYAGTFIFPQLSRPLSLYRFLSHFIRYFSLDASLSSSLSLELLFARVNVALVAWIFMHAGEDRLPQQDTLRPPRGPEKCDFSTSVADRR